MIGRGRSSGVFGKRKRFVAIGIGITMAISGRYNSCIADVYIKDLVVPRTVLSVFFFFKIKIKQICARIDFELVATKVGSEAYLDGVFDGILFGQGFHLKNLVDGVQS